MEEAEEKIEEDVKILSLGVCRWYFSFGMIVLLFISWICHNENSGRGKLVEILTILQVVGLVYCLAGGFCAVFNMYLDPKNGKKWIREECWFAGTFIAYLFLAAALPFSCYASPKALEMSCRSNLKKIYYALCGYANDNGGFLPPENGAEGLDYLRRGGYVTDCRTFLCPVAKLKFAEQGRLTEQGCSYIYYGGGALGGREIVIVTDKPGNHGGTHNILELSGNVKGVDE